MEVSALYFKRNHEGFLRSGFASLPGQRARHQIQDSLASGKGTKISNDMDGKPVAPLIRAYAAFPRDYDVEFFRPNARFKFENSLEQSQKPCTATTSPTLGIVYFSV